MDGNKTKDALFLAFISGISIFGGFTYALAASKKKDPESFGKGTSNIHLHQSGSALAVRALKWGSFYAIGGVSLICYGIWKMSGANNMKEFREKMGQIFPRVKKNEPQGRTEFENLTDLLQYVIDEDKKMKDRDATPPVR